MRMECTDNMNIEMPIHTYIFFSLVQLFLNSIWSTFSTVLGHANEMCKNVHLIDRSAFAHRFGPSVQIRCGRV